ncbi:putative kynurenine formamidase superfamily [Helianthus annuus]|nr:putative kynurenine formamidase superfamily [Helianthus annuus]
MTKVVDIFNTGTIYVWFHEIILVGLKLEDVEAGIYNVHCLPLRLLRAEGTLIRCILI